VLKKIRESPQEVSDNIPATARVLDVGGGMSPFARADYVIDYVPLKAARLDQIKYGSTVRVTKDTYIQHDICSREPWPFPDKYFDFAICSHTLEDLRDPVWVCSELVRVSKAGYIETPSRLYETTFNLEIKNMAGASHHRWIVDLTADNRLRFTFKHMQVHCKAVNSNRRKLSRGPEDILQCVWHDSFEFFENYLVNGPEVFEYYLDRPVDEKEKWLLYRKLDSRNIFIRWASYFKNTNPTLGRLIRQLRSK